MKQPTPEEWWNTLSDEDRKAFTVAAGQAFLSPELAAKLTHAGVLYAMGGFNHEMNIVFPGPYRDYAEEHGDEDGQGD